MTIQEYKNQLEQTQSLQGVERSHYSLLHQYLKEFFLTIQMTPAFIIEGTVRSQASVKMFPDFQILNTHATGLIGLIEAKDYGKDITYLMSGKDPQVKKYLEHQPNLIVTNFERFALLSLNKNKVVVLADHSLFEETEATHALLQRFIQVDPNMDLGAFDIYCTTLAHLANNVEIELKRVLKKELKKEDSLFYRFFYNILRDTLHLTNQEEAKFAHSLIESYVFYQIFNQQLDIKIDILEELVEAFLKKGIESVNDDKLSFTFQQLEEYIMRDTKGSEESKEQFRQWIYQYQERSDEQTLFTYFYEHFLTMWEKEINKHNKNKKSTLKKDLGVYYTPKPVVSFIVDAVNTLLQKEFGFQVNPELGLGNKQVKLLDFATGTGTFLLEALEQTFHLLGAKTARQKEEDIASMLMRFYGFEIMVTPWVLAKYNLRQKVNELLGNENFNINDSQIYLTNTLEHNSLAHKLEFSLIEKFSENIVHSNQLKSAKDIFVIIGNPPYNSDTQNKQIKIKNSTHNDNTFMQIEALLKDYKPEGEKNLKTLSDDYIKFIRWSHKKIVENGKGIVAIITPHSFLSGATYRAMRNKLMEDFNHIYILNLHGNNNTKRFDNDYNVFDIKTGVTISIFVKTKEKTSKEECQIYYHELIGKRKEKFTYLEAGFQKARWQLLDPLGFDSYLDTLHWGKSYNNLRFFIPTTEIKLNIDAYGEFWGVGKVFKEFSTGIETKHDKFAVSFTAEEAEEKISDLLELPEYEFRNTYRKKEKEVLRDTDWTYKKAYDDANKYHEIRPYKSLLYRPFDKRTLWYTETKGIVARPSINLMKHTHIVNNLILGFTRFATSSSYYKHIFVSTSLVESGIISNRTSERGQFAPLYLLPAQPKLSKKAKKESLNLDIQESNEPQLNFTPAFMTFYKELQAQWSADLVTPERIFAYIYAVLSTPAYQEKFNDLLSLDYPRVFFTQDKECFIRLADLGQQLIATHTMDNSALNAHTRSDAISLDILEIQEKLDQVDDEATYEKLKDGIIHFDNKQLLILPPEHLSYTIGSYEVIKTFINARKHMPLQKYRETLWQVIVAVDRSLYLEKELNVLLRNAIK